jgi:GntR family transcriptional regulator/MocR family aminotransferase
VRVITFGRHDRHPRRMRSVYGARRDALMSALAEHAPTVELSGLAAGFHAVARLPRGADEDAIVAQARTRGIGLYAMSGYRLSGGPDPPQLVLGFGNLTESAIRRGNRRGRRPASVTARQRNCPARMSSVSISTP